MAGAQLRSRGVIFPYLRVRGVRGKSQPVLWGMCQQMADGSEWMDQAQQTRGQELWSSQMAGSVYLLTWQLHSMPGSMWHPPPISAQHPPRRCRHALQHVCDSNELTEQHTGPRWLWIAPLTLSVIWTTRCDNLYVYLLLKLHPRTILASCFAVQTLFLLHVEDPDMLAHSDQQGFPVEEFPLLHLDTLRKTRDDP